MQAALATALERVGWDTLYERHIVGLSTPNQRGERIALSPFPYLLDRNPSFSVNTISGLWHDWKLGQGGNYVQFVAYLEPSGFNDEGQPLVDFGATERRLMQEQGLATAISRTWLGETQALLQQDLALQHLLFRLKPWTPHGLQSLGIGYDSSSERIVIPIWTSSGELVNCRMYRPGGQPKTLWLQSGTAGNFLFPASGWQEPQLILVEGEPDVISLRSLGFPAVSGTMGAGRPVPDDIWWRNRVVYVLMDIDTQGQEASQHAIRLLREHAQQVLVCALPEWPSRPEKADISDYLLFLRDQGWEPEQLQRAVVEILQGAQPIEHPHAVFDAEPLEMPFASILSGDNLYRRVSFDARVSGRSEKRFLLPTLLEVNCPASGHNYCQRCPMRQQFHGHGRFRHDPRSETSLKLIGHSNKEQLDAVKEIVGIPRPCPDPVVQVIQAVDVEPVILNSSTVEAGDEMQLQEHQRREAYVLANDQPHLEENQHYDFTGFLYPHPKSQQAVMLLDQFSSNGFRRQFELLPEHYEELKIFQTNQRTVWNNLITVVEDLSNSVTQIFERQDLHLLYRSVWHSLLSFQFMGTTIQRGWMEALVVGDTRCGKSVTFRRLAEYYGLGILVDCKNQTPAGILGSVVTSPTTGERYVVAGILPQQDGKIVCFDEFHVPKWERQSIIEYLSSTRSEGTVRISKAATAQFRARVRSIWLANPGLGKLMSELGKGIEVIPRIIHQPEDIARFDVGLTVTQDDISTDVINRIREAQSPYISSSTARLLLAWAYSRRPDQVLWKDNAESDVIEMARRMYERYDPSIPLVEPADQRVRVAKMAVSIAVQCFSTDEKGQNVVVGPEHVNAAGQLFTYFYEKTSMAYGEYSQKVRASRTLDNPAQLLELFNVTLNPQGRQVAESLLSLDRFTERTFGTLLPPQLIYARNMLQQLYANRCVHLVERGYREFYECTPAFLRWLRQYLEGRFG